MDTLRILLSIIFIILSIVITIIVLLQEGKAQGLGAISGAAESYWGKNKGRSMEGTLVKMTTACVVIFLVLTAVLNLSIFWK